MMTIVSLEFHDGINNYYPSDVEITTVLREKQTLYFPSVEHWDRNTFT